MGAVESALGAFNRISPNTGRKHRKGVEGLPVDGWQFDEFTDEECETDHSDAVVPCGWCDGKLLRYTYRLIHPSLPGYKLHNVGGCCAVRMGCARTYLETASWAHSIKRHLARLNQRTHLLTLRDRKSVKLQLSKIPETNEFEAIFYNSSKKKELHRMRGADPQKFSFAVQRHIESLPYTTRRPYKPRKDTTLTTENDAAF